MVFRDIKAGGRKEESSNVRILSPAETIYIYILHGYCVTNLHKTLKTIFYVFPGFILGKVFVA